MSSTDGEFVALPSPPKDISEIWSGTPTYNPNLHTAQDSTPLQSKYRSTIISLPSGPITSVDDNYTSLLYDVEERVSNIDAYHQVDCDPNSSDQTYVPISPLTSLSQLASDLDIGDHNPRQWSKVKVDLCLDRDLTPNVIIYVNDSCSESSIKEHHEHDLHSALLLMGNHGDNLKRLCVTVPRDYVPEFIDNQFPTLKEHFTRLEWCGSVAAFPASWHVKQGPFAYLQTLRLTHCMISVDHCAAILSHCEQLNELEVDSLAALSAPAIQWQSQLPQPRNDGDVKRLDSLKRLKLTSSVDLIPLFARTKFPQLVEMSLSLDPKLQLDPWKLPWSERKPWELVILSQLNDSDHEDFKTAAKDNNHKFTYNIPPTTA